MGGLTVKVDSYSGSVYKKPNVTEPNKPTINQVWGGSKIQSPDITPKSPWQVEFSPDKQIDVSKILAGLGKDGKTYNGVKVINYPEWGNSNKGRIQYSIPGKLFGEGNGIPIMLNVEHENGKVTKISRNVSEDTLATNLKMYGNDKLPLLKEIKKSFKLPEPNKFLIEREKQIEKERKQEQAELAKITEREGRWILDDKSKLARTSQPRESMSDIKGADEVFQGEYSMGEVKNTRYMQTFGIGPCVALTLYDKASKTGIMAHIDNSEKVKKSMPAMIAQLQQKGIKPENLEARIIGGQTGQSEDTVKELNQALSQYKVPVSEEDILGKGTRAIMMDLNDGKVYDYDETIHETPEEQVRLKGMSTFTSKTLSRKFKPNQ